MILRKNSELQAVLGVAKDSADMVALRTQARQLGDNTAASADDAAGAQIIIAKAGGDKDAITAATPVTLNMALANRKTMEENATLLMGVKSAFGLANDQVAHIGDVISQTMNKSAANFEGLSDTLTYAAPVAKCRYQRRGNGGHCRGAGGCQNYRLYGRYREPRGDYPVAGSHG